MSAAMSGEMATLLWQRLMTEGVFGPIFIEITSADFFLEWFRAMPGEGRATMHMIVPHLYNFRNLWQRSTLEPSGTTASFPRLPEGPEEPDPTKPQCTVCLDRPTAVVFGCGHPCVCRECAKTLRASDCFRCPICRLPVEQWLPFYHT